MSIELAGKITLTGKQETLLIPLYSKAVESQRPNPIIVDPKAQEILELIEYDFSELNVPIGTVLTLCIRANRFDFYTRQFLTSHPDGIVIHLGCGLDSRCLRVDSAGVPWFDIDLPPVIELRRKFFTETNTYHMIACSVTDPEWIDQIPAAGRPVLVVAEGLTMYLAESEVKTLVLKLKEAFAGCHLVFDAYSTFTVRKVKNHPSLKKTGAVIRWGIDDPKDIEQWAQGIQLKEEWYYTQAQEIQKLKPVHRLIFGITNLFDIAKKAHRILYFYL